MSKTNENAWAEEIKTMLFRLNKSIITTIDYFPKGSFISISKVCLNHLPLDHPKQMFMFAPYAAAHTTYHVASKDVDIIPITQVHATLKNDLFLQPNVLIEEGTIINISEIHHTNHRVFFKFSDRKILIGFDEIEFTEKKEKHHSMIDISVENASEISMQYVKTREKLLQNEKLTSDDYDILLDTHNSLNHFYQVFGDIKYKEQADAIIVLLKQNQK